MTRSEFRFFDHLRVRWAEIDAQQIVFNAHYLMYLDTAIAGYWRALALPYAPTMESLQGDLFVRKAMLEYHASARYDDLLDVGMRCARVGTSSIAFAAGVFRGETLLVSGELIYVFADPQAQTAKPVPRSLSDLMQGYEAGQPVIDVRVAGWDALGAEARAIRTEVFVREQQIPAGLEWDAADSLALHAVAYNRLGRALATGRLLQHAAGVAKIGRMAVSQSVRSSGLGRAVLNALMDAARARGDREVRLHAQISAAPFYQRAGFKPRGDSFQEAGIAHIEMVHALDS
jgi:YbgC/YbaW family acyl-CoA thioester hydrolase